jgi:putative ABC transport system ATP-binding protein
MDNKVLIQTINLHKSFTTGEGQVEVLRGIDMKIEQGKFIIIFGPSGCGKSTLLHTLLGLESPTEGKVLFAGKDFYSLSEDERALDRRDKVGMIYQQPLWIGSLNVLENTIFSLHLLNYDEKIMIDKAIKLLANIGMEKWAYYKPTELSSGQQQKIALVRALMTDPILLVADEPTGNLDTVSGQELLTIFMDLVKKGKTIVMVTHDLEYLKYASKIFHMVDGKVVEEYTPNKKARLRPSTIARDYGGQGKKEINGDILESNVRDPEFLKKLKL